MGTNVINSFTGEYAFLSNFYECNVVYNGVTYHHTEGAFQAQKTTDKDKQIEIAKLSPRDVKKACGRYGNLVLRADWEDVKDNIMYEVVKAKFEQHEDLRKKLLDTGDATLVEGNTWHDNYWGDCSCGRCVKRLGKNMLGKTLMRVRDELR